ncbi:hypothetical protein [Nocardioides antri]|uniref:Uncharacterized protein n=1 Tax=Nocardioides antri TaxID=2607659 RepID=A0A5B1M536_9ACTN|nr:hypothetical protein [Nocardioides antri]KAA1427269.1 hypothetical protein F0U47_07160 [Nocardioides antri]
MTDEQWLRDGLADAVPEPPGNPDRARAARGRARRRRTTVLAVVGTAGAVAAAAALTATLSSGDVTDDDQTASDPPASVVECPPIKIRDGVAQGSAIDQPDPDAPDAVPGGATSARLCQGPGTPLEVPADALVTDVETLAASINALDEAPEHQMCTHDLGPGYRIVFGYGDSTTFVVSGQLYGCHTLVVGSGYRADPEAAQSDFLSLLQAQRDAAEPPEEPPVAPSCETDGTAADATGQVAEMAAAVLCVNEGRVPRWSLPIPADDLAALLADIEVEAVRGGGVNRCYRDAPWISGVTVWGDRVEVGYHCDTYVLPDGRTWVPSTEAQQILDRLVSEVRPVP